MCQTFSFEQQISLNFAFSETREIQRHCDQILLLSFEKQELHLRRTFYFKNLETPLSSILWCQQKSRRAASTLFYSFQVQFFFKHLVVITTILFSFTICFMTISCCSDEVCLSSDSAPALDPLHCPVISSSLRHHRQSLLNVHAKMASQTTCYDERKIAAAVHFFLEDFLYEQRQMALLSQVFLMDFL